MRLVLDTNTVVSALLWKGSPHDLFAAVRERRDIALYSSPKLLAELAELADVLGREKLAPAVAASNRSPEEQLRQYISLVRIVTPASVQPVIVADPDDDHVIACALAAGADLIVSGDRHLLNLRSYQGMPIVAVTEALARVAKAGAGN